MQEAEREEMCLHDEQVDEEDRDEECDCLEVGEEESQLVSGS